MRLGHLARLRQAVYRLFGAALLYPDADWVATLPRAAGPLLRTSAPLAGLPFGGSWRRFLAALGRLGSADRPALEAAYVRHFVAGPGARPALPYESAYLPPEASGWLLGALDQEYARAGFEVSSSLGEPPDHTAVELEFMGILCGEEATAWEGPDLGRGLRQLEWEASFLHQHLGRWFPLFARQVAEQAATGFYAAAIGAARAFLLHDLDLTAALLGRYREAGRC